MVHYLGLFFGPLIGIAASIFYAWWAFLIVVPVLYVAALITHPLVEGNSNKPFANRPLWSVISFFRMMLLDFSGNLGKELARLTRQ
jgi:hypothetical protein